MMQAHQQLKAKVWMQIHMYMLCCKYNYFLNKYQPIEVNRMEGNNIFRHTYSTTLPQQLHFKHSDPLFNRFHLIIKFFEQQNFEHFPNYCRGHPIILPKHQFMLNIYQYHFEFQYFPKAKSHTILDLQQSLPLILV